MSVGWLLPIGSSLPFDIQPLAAIRQPEKKRAGNAVGGLMTRHELTWDEGVFRMKHLAGKVSGDGFGLKVKVAEHCIRPPSSQELDHVCVDLGDKQRHSASRSEGAG